MSCTVLGGVSSGKSWALCTDEDDFSRFLGSKSTMDTDDWAPDMDAVQAMIHSTLATKQFEHDNNERVRMTR